MKRTLLVLTALLASAAAPAPQPSTRPAHDREPWIFRCVLDNNARMVVLSLGHDVWAAYDADQCRLAKLWVGDVNFSGAVFDTKHGPQPKSRGVMLMDRPIKLEPARPGATNTPDGTHVEGYRGYRIDGDHATLRFEFNGVTVEEMLAVVAADEKAKTVTVRRTTKVDGAFRQTEPVTMHVSTSPLARKIVLHEGTARLANAEMPAIALPGTITSGAEPPADVPLILTEPTTIVVDTTYSTTAD